MVQIAKSVSSWKAGAVSMLTVKLNGPSNPVMANTGTAHSAPDIMAPVLVAVFQWLLNRGVLQ